MAILRVREPFAVGHRVLRPGDLVESDDPAVKGREQFFEPVEVAASRESARVEQATAAPGEKRSLARSRKPKA